MDHGLEWSRGATSRAQFRPNRRLGEPPARHRSGYERRVGEVDCPSGPQRSRCPPGEQPEQFGGRPRGERSSQRRGSANTFRIYTNLIDAFTIDNNQILYGNGGGFTNLTYNNINGKPTNFKSD